MADPFFDDDTLYDTYYAAYQDHHHDTNTTPLPGGGASPTSPTATPRHTGTLSLLLALSLTLANHRDLAAHLLYWALRLLRPTPDLSSFPPIPFPLRPPHGGARSPYWATLDALRWEAGRNVAATRLAFGSYVGFYVLLCLFRGGGVLWEVVGAVLGPVARVYLYLLGVATVVRWGMWGFAGMMAFLRFVGFAVVEVVKGVVGFWGPVLMRWWRLVFAVGMMWVCVEFVKGLGLEFEEVWQEMAGTVLLWLAKGIYLFGDVVRDMAKFDGVGGMGGYRLEGGTRDKMLGHYMSF